MLLPIIAILLAIVSSWVWISLSTSGMSYHTVSTAKQYAQQFEMAETALNKAEQWLHESLLLPEPVAFCLQKPCILQAQQASYLPSQEVSWWQASGNYAVTAVNNETAFYAVEQLMDSSSAQIRYYRITSWALLNQQHEPTILQSIWIKNSANKWQGRNAWRMWGI